MKIQIKLKSLDKTSLNLFLLFIRKLLQKNNKPFIIQALPTKKKRISLLKSPHVNKKAFEQFELKIYRSLLILKNTTFNNMGQFLLINKPNNILIKIKYLTT